MAKEKTTFCIVSELDESLPCSLHHTEREAIRLDLETIMC